MSQQIRAELISVGTELLLGQIANTNAQWISKHLANNGISVYYHTVVGDNLARLAQVFENSKRSDVVIVTGGLGPTEDDLTREAFQQITGLSIIEHEPTIQSIEEYFKRTNRQMTPNNRKQANIFEGSIVFENSVGIAPGIAIDYNDTTYIFTPGVPSEMKAIMSEFVIPHLVQKYHLNHIIHSKVLRFIGIGESQLEHELQTLISNQTNPTIAPLAKEGEVTLRLSAFADNKEDATQLINTTEKEILSIVGNYLYGYDDETIAQKVVERLKENQLTIASAESLTGGLFSSTIVDIPEASHVLNGAATVYSPTAKEHVLDIPELILSKHGTVSSECAELMAKQVKKLYQSDIGISFTGVAGPTMSEGKDVGTVFISICDQYDNCHTVKHLFNGNRFTIRTRAVKKGLERLYQLIK